MAYGLTVFVLLLGGAVGGVSYRIHRQNGREGVTGLPLHPVPDASSRILVLAPHCDDETLACGGLLREAVRAGAAVRVIFTTNGDGFNLAVWRANPGVRVRPAHYVRFGLRRQREVLAALDRLGVPREAVTFLGYPDRGIAHLWLYHWRDAYRSPYTRVSASPYPNSARPHAPYTGEALLADLESAIRDFRPTAVYLPHPNDDHSDHWATANFGRAALEHLGLTDRVAAYAYLVHRGDWPVPQGLHPGRGLAPPSALARLDTLWTEFPLDADGVAAKENALREYRSQMLLMRRFLTSFMRRNELFGLVLPAKVPDVPPGAIRVDGRGDEWAAIPAALREPVKDRLPVELQGGADLVSVRACREGDRLLFLLTTRKMASPRLQYVLHLRTLDRREHMLSVAVGPGTRAQAPGVLALRRGRDIEVSVPLSHFRGARSLLIGAVARTSRFALDRTGWRVLRVDPPSIPTPGTVAASQVQPRDHQ